MDKIQKFLLKLDKKQRYILLDIVSDINTLNIGKYNIIQLEGFHGIFRLRKGKIRIVFRKDGMRGMILDIAYRKDAYR